MSGSAGRGCFVRSDDAGHPGRGTKNSIGPEGGVGVPEFPARAPSSATIPAIGLLRLFEPVDSTAIIDVANINE